MSKPKKVEPYHGHLHHHRTHKPLRHATRTEAAAAQRSETGLIVVDKTPVYVAHVRSRRDIDGPLIDDLRQARKKGA